MSAQNHKTRPARNNSLQRMLELERRFMMERLQPTTTATPIRTPFPTSISATSAKTGFAPAAHLTIQAHRPEILAQSGPGPRQGVRPPGPFQMTPGKQPPLTINTAVVNLTQPAVAKIESVEPTDSNPSVQPPPERMSSKVVSFNVPPEENAERGSICQSPSWEAYDRRRKEKNAVDKDPKKDSKKDPKKEPKKDPKEAKKEKEKQKEKVKERQKEKEKEKQKEKEKEKLKLKELKEKQKEQGKEEKSRSLLRKTTHRLSKSPPMSSVNAIDHANRMSRSPPTPPPDGSRPGSAAGPRSSSREDRQRSHSRSSSISSLFRRPFESRQSPVEDNEVVETGFIGGIKLEMERHAALQKALDEQLKADKGDEADIHPALRTNNGSSSEAEASAPSSSKKAVDAQRRAYPPITRLTSVHKTRSIVMSPGSTEGATFDRWKAFVGLRPGAKPGVLGTEGVSAVDMERPAARGPGMPLSKMQQPSQMPEAAHIQAGFKGKQVLNAEIRNQLRDEPAPMTIQTDLTTYDAAKISPPLSLAGPLEPPPRSPKRNSISSTTSVMNPGHAANQSPQCSSSSRFSSSNTSAKRPGSSQDDSGSADTSIDSSGPGSQEPNGGGVPLDSNQQDSAAVVQGLRMPTWNEIRSTVVQAISSNVSLTNVRMSQGSIRDDSEFTVRRLTGAPAPTRSSSDNMSYEEFHSTSDPGTPDTSRPQSEKGAIPFSDIEQRLASQGDGRPGSRESKSAAKELVGGGLQKSHPKVNLGATAEPARMAVVNAATQVLHMPQGRAVAQIRVTSETGVTHEPSYLPKLKHQPLRASPSPSREKMHASQPPCPASYLEEARKATPLAPPPGLRSPSLAPRGHSSNRTPPASVRSNPSSLNMSGRLSPSGDPVAKMFVECCGCKYYHDMPSDLYEAMANPESVISPRSSASSSNNNFHSSHGPESSVSRIDLAGLITMRVRCPWCNHEMSTKCCAGYAAMVYLKQRLH